MSSLIRRNFCANPIPQNVRRWLFSGNNENTFTEDKHKYVVKLKLKDFNPNELAVRLFSDHEITVEGSHEQKDQYRIVTQQFIRSFLLPRDVDASKIESKLIKGVLTITAPKDPNVEEFKNIPIQTD